MRNFDTFSHPGGGAVRLIYQIEKNNGYPLGNDENIDEHRKQYNP